ncbi:MAG: MBL fold metallo-hydrolase [Cytophagales bacterium]|nr:MBL fold metallo-hydrolase [Cytophagales bacterium]MDW8385324.1 MBL fold metallo-hydrolase [Flammeovirgaceae bacterium]
MKVTLLGTGTSQGIPVITCECPVCQSDDKRDKRLRTSAAVFIKNVQIVIDTGTDFRMQMLQNNIKQLDAILYTHAHKDHTGGMDDIRPFYFKNKQQDIPVFASADVFKQLRNDFSYMFAEAENRYPGVASIQENIIQKNVPFHFRGIEILPIEVWHGKLPILGFRIGKFAYITDASYIEPNQIELLKDLEVLVLNALQHAPHYSHFTLQEAIATAQEIGAKMTYFTHISHTMGKHACTEKLLPPNIRLGYDGLTFNVED